MVGPSGSQTKPCCGCRCCCGCCYCSYLAAPAADAAAADAAAESFQGITFVEIDYEIISTVILLPSSESFKKDWCQLQAKVCARSTG